MEVKEITRDKVQQDALDIAINNNRATLGISMGVGKTRIAIQHLMKLYDPFIRVLVVVPKWSVKDSWEVEVVKMDLFFQLDKHIKYTTYLSLNKLNPKDYDIVYLDECHSLLETHETFLSEFKGRVLGLTGTPPKSGEKLKMVKKYCPVKYTFSVDDAADNDISLN